MSQETSAYDAVIADLEIRRDQLTAMIENLKQLRAMGTVLPTPPTPSGRVAGSSDEQIPHDAFFGLKIPEAAKKYLGIMKRTRPHPELCDALLEGGIKTTAVNFRETVRSILSKNPAFVKINGQWGLSDWYPGARRERRGRLVPHQPLPGDETGGAEKGEEGPEGENKALVVTGRASAA